MKQKLEIINLKEQKMKENYYKIFDRRFEKNNKGMEEITWKGKNSTKLKLHHEWMSKRHIQRKERKIFKFFKCTN